jgi:hypothetical protein
MLLPDLASVRNIYGWVRTVEADLTSIGLYCITSSAWAVERCVHCYPGSGNRGCRAGEYEYSGRDGDVL